jgi:hypothetical protein
MWTTAKSEEKGMVFLRWNRMGRNENTMVVREREVCGGSLNLVYPYKLARML